MLLYDRELSIGILCSLCSAKVDYIIGKSITIWKSNLFLSFSKYY